MRLRRTRVALVVAGERLGGAERGAIDLAAALRDDEGAEVELVALDGVAGPARALAEERALRWRTVPVPWVGGHVAKALALARLTAALRRLRPHALVAFTNLPNATVGATWRATRASVFVWTQCDVNGTTRINSQLFRRSLRGAPVVVTWADHARAWLVEEFGVDAARVHVVPQTVELPPVAVGPEWRARLGVEPGALLACMVAHFHAGKDHATVLRAWRRVVDELDRRAVLVLAGGDRGTQAATKALAFDLDLGPHVRFLGEVEDVSGLLDACDLAVFASERECLPRGVLEPMSRGLAVAAVDIPGVREALGSAGDRSLAAPADADGLAAVVLTLARDNAAREAAGRANAEHVRARREARPFAQVYASLLAERLAPRP